MPGVPVIQHVNKPMVMKDRKPSVAGIKWVELLKDHGVNPEFEGIISFISLMTPNASSSKQMKELL
jgi:hypothetical protein